MTPSLFGNLLRLHDEWLSRACARQSLIDWATAVMAPSGLRPAVHHRFLLDNLTSVTDGSIRRLMVQMPPGSAKSTYASVIFPAWWFAQHPVTSVILVSHTEALAKYFSRRTQTLIKEYHQRIGYNLVRSERSACHWSTDAGGEYFAVGIRGAITGRRADLAIIDDPIKSANEAESATHRQDIWDWYTAELVPRLKPEARIVVVMTRWHERDLGGQLIDRGPHEWNVLRLPAIAEEFDPIGRPVGAPLWPDWEPLEALNKKRLLVGDRIWSALFQQSPKPAASQLFKTERLRVLDSACSPQASPIRVVRAWDLAATPGNQPMEPDWTVGLKLVYEHGGRFVVEDVVRFQGNPRDVQEEIVSSARSDGHSVVISLPIDPGQAGKAQIAQLSSLLAGYRVYASHERGSKLSRAEPVASQIDAGNFAMLHAAWNHAFVDEMRAFPHGDKDDQIDALSRAFMTILELPDPTRRVYLPFSSR